MVTKSTSSKCPLQEKKREILASVRRLPGSGGLFHSKHILSHAATCLTQPDCGLCTERVCVHCLSLSPPSFLCFSSFFLSFSLTHTDTHTPLLHALLCSLASLASSGLAVDCQHVCWVYVCKPLDGPDFCLIAASIGSNSTHRQKKKRYCGEALAC